MQETGERPLRGRFPATRSPVFTSQNSHVWTGVEEPATFILVVRDDDGRSDILSCKPLMPPGRHIIPGGGKRPLYDYLSSGGRRRAYKVSYNRPFDTRSRRRWRWRS
jgi:hypothetical protein